MKEEDKINSLVEKEVEHFVEVQESYKKGFIHGLHRKTDIIKKATGLTYTKEMAEMLCKAAFETASGLTPDAWEQEDFENWDKFVKNYL